MRGQRRCDALTHFNLFKGGGNLVAVAMVVCRRVFYRNEIATWFDRLTMSGCAPRNDRWGCALLAMAVRAKV